MDNIVKVIGVKMFRDKEYRHTFLTYFYDIKNRIERIIINHEHSYSDKDFGYVYDKNGNLTQQTLNGKIIDIRSYDDKGNLIYIENR